MSNNSLPDLPNEFSIHKIKNPCSVVPRIYTRFIEYIKEEDSKIRQLKYTVVRQYLHNLLITIKNNKQSSSTNQLKTILNSPVLNGIEYSLHNRMLKFIIYLNMICEKDVNMNNIVQEWDNNVVYF